MCIGSTPKIPESPTPVEPIPAEKIHAQDEGESEAINVENKRRRLASRKGHASTILTGGQGAPGSPSIAAPGGSTILGGSGQKKKLGQ